MMATVNIFSDCYSSGTSGGKVQSNTDNARPGNTVTLTVIPDKGYKLESLTVTDRNGKEIVLSDQGDNQYTFKMPNGDISVNVAFGLQTQSDVKQVWANRFLDVDTGEWYYDAVRYVQENGLMNGYSESEFGPNDPLSRAQLTQILFNREGRPTVDASLPFADVTVEMWCREAVRWASAKGIVGGYNNGFFGPDDSITREQLVVILWRYAGSPLAASKELNFTDADKASDYALEALRWAVEKGVLNGAGSGKLAPQGLATRAEVAQMLKNYFEI